VEHVRLIGIIYVKSLASRAPTVEETRIFEQEHKSRELEEDLKTILNFLRGTITFTVTPTPQVIVILDLEEEVEILPQLVVEE